MNKVTFLVRQDDGNLLEVTEQVEAVAASTLFLVQKVIDLERQLAKAQAALSKTRQEYIGVDLAFLKQCTEAYHVLTEEIARWRIDIGSQSVRRRFSVEEIELMIDRLRDPEHNHEDGVVFRNRTCQCNSCQEESR